MQDDEFDKERKWLLAYLDNGEGVDKAGYRGDNQKEDESDDDDEDGIECGCCFSTYSFVRIL